MSFRYKFPDYVKLKELQKYAREGGILQNMQTLKQTRLSVSKVSKKEWDFILTLGGYEEDDKVSTRNNSEELAEGVFSDQMDAKNFGAGKGGVADTDSALTAVWMGANSTDNTGNAAAADAKV